MRAIIVTVCTVLVTSCATNSSFVLREQTGEWSVHQHQPDSVIAPLVLSVGTPQDGFALHGVSMNRKTTKVFAIQSVEGREVEVSLLNGGESYEFSVLKDGKGFSYTFDEQGKLLDSCRYEHGYTKPQNRTNGQGR